MAVTTVVRVLLVLIFAHAMSWSGPTQADSLYTVEEIVNRLATGDVAEKVEAIEALTRSADPAAVPLLQALKDGTMAIAPDGRVIISTEDGVKDAITLQPLVPPPTQYEAVTTNNRVRGQLSTALSAFQLYSKDAKERLEAAKSLESSAQPSVGPILTTVLAHETDAQIKAVLSQIKAGIDLKSPDVVVRLTAAKALGASTSQRTKGLLYALLEKDGSGQFLEPDARVREEAQFAIRMIDRRLALGEYAGRLFSGLSLGSILLLAALGLAITYGLLGVINMAHGEMIMIGAYATYMTQQIIRLHAPGWVEWYPLFAVPIAFVAAALVGMALERTVIRWLYGRPLETLLATWGISLFLIQLVRQIFGAQNVEVANPSWMSGGIELTNVTLPYNRIVIMFFALAVLGAMWLVLARTRLGLFVRGVTQNRTMAACVGVPTGRVDLMAFGLGSGIAGLAGCALSQIGNVGPDLGQGYIIDSFMVVVLGGVGQLAGTVYAALGLGVAMKFMEPYIGAVLTKILILVLIIAFIQKRPQGLFALRGRAVEA
ncbi:MAG TPA: urea ABC transporter permease subunit UrtB [Burkholderiales bacterium]|nr:urea ABC transporter permease subunit UrtB [Burkholderiales bacterium]